MIVEWFIPILFLIVRQIKYSSSSLFWTDLEKYPEVKAATKFIVEESKVLYRFSLTNHEASQPFLDEFVMEMAEHILAKIIREHMMIVGYN